MSERCNRSFDEARITGYLDGALTQADRQRVRLHLEECAACRRLLASLRETREATMTTEFRTPTDDQWREAPRGGASRLSLGLGWAVLVAWLVGITGFAIGQAWSSPATLVEKLLAFGGASGVALIFLSVAIDRIKTWKTDPYRRVER